MKRSLFVALAMFLSISATAQATYQPTAENLKARQEFSDSKLGIFLHWGIYSTFAQGEWLRKYGDTVYGTIAGDIKAQDWGVTTRKGNRLFIHIFNLKAKELQLPLSCKVKKAFVFEDKSEVEFLANESGVTLKFNTTPSGTDYIVELITE